MGEQAVGAVGTFVAPAPFAQERLWVIGATRLRGGPQLEGTAA